MARMATDSAVSRAFAVEDRSSLYQRGRGGSLPGLPIGSAAATRLHLLVGRLAEEVGSQPTIATSQQCQERHAEVGINVTAGPVLDQGEPAVFQEPLAGCGDLVVGSTTGAGLPLAHEPRIQQTLERGYRGTLGKASRLLKLVRSRHPAVDQRQDK